MIELYYQGGPRTISAVGNGMSFCCSNRIGDGTNLCCNFVKSASNASRAIVFNRRDGSFTRWYQSTLRSAYFNGVYAVFGFYSGTEREAFEVYTSTNRVDWTVSVSVDSSLENFLYEGFSVTPTGFFGWFRASSSSTGWYSVSSSDGVNWSQSEIAQDRWRVYNPMLQTLTSNVIGDPWVYGYDQPNGIMVGIGGSISTTFFGVTSYSKAEDTKIYTSTNGTSWSLVHAHTSVLTFCAAGGGQMVAGNQYGMIYSPDMGTSWSSCGAGNITYFQPVSADYLGGAFVIHGYCSADDSKGSFQTSFAILKNGVLSAKRPNSLLSTYT